MIEEGKSESLLLTEDAFINGEVGFMMKGKFSYGECLRTALFSLVFGPIGNAVDEFSIEVAFSLSRLFLLGSVG